MTVLGVDYGGSPDAPDLFRAGAQFGVARAITELGTVDSTFHRDVAAMRAAGLIAGGYHWLVPQATRDVKGQVHQYLDAAGDYIASGPFLNQLDVEPRSGGSGPAPTWRDVLTFAEEFELRAPGKEVLPYGGGYLWATRSFGLPSNAASFLPHFWLSRYPFRATGLSLGEAYSRVPADAWSVSFGGWKRATFLQFEGTVTVAGVSGSYDLDAFAGDINDLLRIAGVRPMNVSLVKGEDWRPKIDSAGNHGVFRATPDRAASIIERLTTNATVRSIAEVETLDKSDPNFGALGDWRLTVRNGKPAYMLRGDWEPLVEGGDPATDAALTNYVARKPLVSVASVVVNLTDGTTATVRTA